MRRIGQVASLFLGLAAVSAAEPPVLRYVPKHEELKYTFGGVAPTHRIKPGTRIVSWTEDCFDGALNKRGQKLSEVLVPGRDNPQTGPFYVEGAEPGDTLVIRIEKLEPARDYAVSAGGPGFGALKGTDKTAMLGPELPEAVWFYDVDRARGVARTRSQDGKLSWEVPLAPFLGCLGVAPAYGEARSTIVPDNFGGNMDCPEVRAGNTVYLGVRVPGALVSFGDGHYAMGDGEIMGTAIEGAMDVELTVDLIKHRETPWPRIENTEWMMSVGAARPLEDAARIAFKDMVRWVQEKTGLGEMDAYEFVSQNARAPITQIVDPEYTVLVKIPKARLPTPSGTPVAATTSPASFDARALDTSVDPCVDFYQFACGGWRKANPIPPDQTRWGRFNELAERNREVLHDILERVRDAKPSRSPIEARVGDYYAACMDEAGVKERGTKPLDPILARVEAIASRQDLFRLLGDHAAHALPALFRFGSAPDMHDSKQTIATVGQGGLGLPDRDDYLKDDAKSKEKRETYVGHVARMLELLGESAEKARADAQVVLRIETALASAHLDRVAMRDPKNRDNPMTLAEIKALAPAFDWDSYFGATGAPRFARLNVTSRKYFAEGNGLVDATPIPDWKTYLRWHVVRAGAPYLGAAFVKEDFRFNREYLNGAKEIEPRWKRCVQATDRGLGDDLGRLYVERTFGAEGKARMRRMIEAITEALREDIETLPWMTPETRKKALAKLQAFRTEKVGYPEKWKDYRTVEVRRTDYFGNARRAEMFEIKRDHERIDEPTDRTLWGMTPPTVNAYYNSANNEIVFPAGILQPPFFDRELDDAVNFGGIGVVIGHEYTHGFDDQGSKFDPEGNLVNWWTPDDLRAFQERTDCIAKEYEGFVSVKDAANGDVHLNGRLTLGENTADNGGLRVAYRALKKTLADKERPRIDGYTPEQRLFLGFANVWCQNVTEQAARQLAQTDTHSPGAFRVIGAVANMEEFREAFACKAGQPMVRENACRVW